MCSGLVSSENSANARMCSSVASKSHDAVSPTTKELAEGVASSAKVGGGARDGKNDFGKAGWNGPCPPKGRHRYIHKVYALDTVLADLGQPTKAELEKAMNGHVVAKGEVVGTYEKQPK